MKIVGLTGGLASGKSTVARQFAELGVPVIDTDAIAHELTASNGAAISAIRAAFGADMIDARGALDRARMRQLVFADPAARERLEAILHPMIRVEVKRRLQTLDTPYAIVVIPLLVETGGYDELLDAVIVVDCPEALQIERAVARSRLTPDEARAIIEAQATRAARLARADHVLDNSAELDNGTGGQGLVTRITALHRCFMASDEVG
jgi:dephospho-CoA kinase